MNAVTIFKEISIGGLTNEQLIKKLVEAGIQFNDYAKALFKHPAFSPRDKKEIVKLVKVKLSAFGIDGPCSFQEIVRRASCLDLRLCPLYLGAFLRLEYLDQPEGPHLTIASAKPDSDEKHPSGFYIRNHNNALWLRGYRAEDNCEWPADNEFVFQK